MDIGSVVHGKAIPTSRAGLERAGFVGTKTTSLHGGMGGNKLLYLSRLSQSDTTKRKE